MLALAVAGLLATAANAQLAPARDPGPTTGADTPYAPVAKEPPEGLWTQVAGAKHNPDRAVPTTEDLVKESPTPIEASFRAVAFRDPNRGFAGGTIEEGGERSPFIYSHTEAGGWREDATFTANGKGFVAAIAWIDEKRALAVGGDGSYPDRERDDGTATCAPDEDPPIGEDQAGSARVWLYQSGEGWRELRNLPDGTPDDELPDAMGGLTALDFFLPDPAKPVEFGIAGGLCQIWHWWDGGFLRDGDDAFEAPYSSRTEGLERLRHRVRSVTFSSPVAELSPDKRQIEAYAVTTGCCSPEDAGGVIGKPEVLSYTPEDGAAADEAVRDAWSVYEPPGAPLPNVPGTITWTSEQTAHPPTWSPPPGGFVSVTATHVWAPLNVFPPRFDRDTAGPNVIASPTGPASDAEHPSHVGGRSVGYTSARLIDGDGDIGGGRYGSVNAVGSSDDNQISAAVPLETEVTTIKVANEGGLGGYGNLRGNAQIGGDEPTGPDGVPDWSVGELTTSGQAIAFVTDPEQIPGPQSAVENPSAYRFCWFNPIGSPPTEPGDYAGCQAGRTAGESSFADRLGAQYESPSAGETSGRAVAATPAHKLMRLPSYRLNAIDVLDGKDVGWAVGDHGAILRLRVDRSRATTRSGDADPPQLGAADTSSAPDADEWGGVNFGGTPGVVPSLADQPRRQDAEPRLHLESTIDTPTGSRVAQIVMSRSGDDGWALLDSEHAMDLVHFDGERWRYCKPGTVIGHDSLRSECNRLSSLRKQGVQISQIVRVPLERDDDPTNDDQLELVGIGGPAGVVRYRGGRWQLESTEALKGLTEGRVLHASSIAFTAPDHGWILSDRPYTGSRAIEPYRVYRFDGTRWIDCYQSPAGVGSQYDSCDPRRRLPRSKDAGSVSSLHAVGDRVYAIGTRAIQPSDTHCSSSDTSLACSIATRRYPMIVYRSEKEVQSGWSAKPREGEYDPGLSSNPDSSQEGALSTASIIRTQNGSYEGWATGSAMLGSARTASMMLRLRPGGQWRPFHDRGAVQDYGVRAVTTLGDRRAGAPPAVAIAPGTPPETKAFGQMFSFNEQRRRWEIVRSDRTPAQNWLQPARLSGEVGALAPDGKGGFWAGVSTAGDTDDGSSFYRYTDRPHQQVFEEIPQPSHRMANRALTALAAAPDGTVWAASGDQTLYRYDRRLGWDAVRISGWEAGRVVTAPSAAFAVAVNRHGEGVVAGRQGRIGEISRSGVALDPAAGTRCTGAAIPPCGTGNDLLAVDIASDGSAIAAGEKRSVLWRPPSGQFRAVQPPPVTAETRFTGTAITQADRVWLTTDTGRIYRGALSSAGEWRWKLEAEPTTALNAIALDDRGRGFAVGARGLILERLEDGSWRELSSQTDVTLHSVALPVGGGEGAIVGGDGRLVLTRVRDRFEVAHERPAASGGSDATIAVALAPGARDGEVEAWAALESNGSPALGRGTGRLLHYASDRLNPIFNPTRAARPLPDAPGPREGELSLAAFGKMDCRDIPVSESRCPDIPNASDYVSVIASRIADELVERSRGPSPADLAVFTGDAVDVGGYTGAQALKSTVNQDPGVGSTVTNSGGRDKLRRWGEVVADGLTDRGVPLLGAVGAQDLAETRVCEAVLGNCPSANEFVRGNENLAWRQAMRQRSRPWGSGPSPTDARLRFRPVRDPFTSRRIPNAVESADDEPQVDVPTGGAPTHYAIDVFDDSRTPREVARIVVVDSSFGSLAASDPVQQPVEPDGGQAAWLEKVLCIRGEPSGVEGCSRRAHQKAIVVSNAPTYSYGPGSGRHTAADGAAFEAILMKNRANLVVSGRIGWNGLYWATAPGLHEPCPGGDYQVKPPEPGSIACGQAGTDLPVGAVLNHPATAGLAAALGESVGPTGEAAQPLSESLTGVLPFVVASGAGGELADVQGEAKEGFWHGYTFVRLDPSGDPKKMVVEQRPVYDWVGIEAQERILRPGQKMRLRGFARSPIGIALEKGNPNPIARYDRIDGPAVTHRYDLVEADPERRWLARTGADGEYVPLDPSIATVDKQSGQIRVGRGNHPRVHAVAILSLGCAGDSSADCDPERLGHHAATYPLIFEPRRTFEPKAQPTAPRAPSVIVQSAVAGVTPPSSPGAPPQIGSVSPPALPSFPSVQPPPATPPIGQPAPTPPPPPPPAPPPPASLAIAAAPPGLTVAPPAAVIPPPAPPINPAPPGGARKEARQRQAATEKSGSDSGAGQDEGLGGDLADAPDKAHGAKATARERTKAQPSFTMVSRPDQPSAWARGALYGGGLTLAALALAAGWGAARPRPRPPAVPAEARARYGRRR